MFYIINCLYFVYLAGRYACVIDRDVPYIQWQDIVIEPLPNIIVGKNLRKFQCMEQTVELTCCATKYDVEWTLTTSADQVTSPGCHFIPLLQKLLSTIFSN